MGTDLDPEQFWQRAKTNLQAGKVRLIFVADEIPDELRRVVEFLNEQMDPAEVLAVEIKQYVGKGLKSLIPRVLGQTADAQRKKSGASRESRQWDEDSFLSDLECKKGGEEAVTARKNHCLVKGAFFSNLLGQWQTKQLVYTRPRLPGSLSFPDCHIQIWAGRDKVSIYESPF